MAKQLPIDEQIDHIVRMMLRGEWRGGQSRKELAKKWGVHERTVGDRAVVASGVLRRAGGELESEILEALAELDTIKALALANQRAFLVHEGKDKSHVEYADEPKLREATDAIRLKMDIRGVTSKSRGRNEGQGAQAGGGNEGVEALLRAVLDDPALRDKVSAMLAGKGKEMH